MDVAELLSDGQLDMIEAGHGCEELQLDVKLRVRDRGFVQQEGPLELIVSPDECREEEFDRALVRIIGVQVVDGVPMVLLEADRTIGDNSRADDWTNGAFTPFVSRSWSG